MTMIPKLAPEQFIEFDVTEQRKFAPRHSRLKLPQTIDGGLFWCGYETVVRDGNELPSTAAEWMAHPWVDQLFDYEYALAVLARRYGKTEGTDKELGVHASKEVGHHAQRCYALLHWIQCGKPTYLIAHETAAALLHTDVSSYLTADLRLPFKGMYVKAPKALGWQVDDEFPDDYIKSGVEAPRDRPPQPLDGFLMVTDSDEVTGEPEITYICCMGIHAHDIAWSISIWWRIEWGKHRTVGEAIAAGVSALNTTGAVTCGDSETLEMFSKLVVSLILYLQTTTPQVRTVQPLTRPTARRKGKHKREWNEWERSTRATVRYVGGPSESYATRSGSKREPADMSRRPPKPHVRSGHYRRQHYGKDRMKVKVNWIKPIQVGDWSRCLSYEQFIGHIFKVR